MIIVAKILQIIISLLLIFLVLIQAKGTGLSSAFGGNFSFYRTRRGLEKAITILTIVFGIVLVANSIAIVLLD